MDSSRRQRWMRYPEMEAQEAAGPGVRGEEEQQGGVPVRRDAALWARWRGAGDERARTELIDRYRPFAARLALRVFRRRFLPGIEFEEYRQFAVVGLLEAVERYEPSSAARFTTYATPRIVGAVHDGIDHLTEQQEQSSCRRRMAMDRLGSLAPERITPDQASRLLEELGDIGVGLAIGYILEGIGVIPEPLDPLPDDAYKQLELRQTRELIWRMVDRLPDNERTILKLHYGEAKLFEEIARGLELTKGRISQLHRQALERLRKLVSKAESCDVTY
ncbi:MAG: sigma-70 family RNA polymerase sigma factor [Anaeromyxobacter sp.]